MSDTTQSGTNRLFTKRVANRDTWVESITRKAVWSGVNLIQRGLPPRDAIDLRNGSTEHLVAIVGNRRGAEHLDVRHANGQFVGYVCGKSVFFNPAGASLKCQWDAHASSCDVVHVNVAPRVVDRVAESIGFDPQSLQWHSGFHERVPSVMQTAKILHKEATGAGFGSQLFVDAITQSLTFELLEHFASCDQRQLTQATELKSRLNVSQTKRALEYLHSTWNQNITLNELASTVTLSEFHFARQFRKATGVAPHQYQLRLRLEKACEMLKRPAAARGPLVNVAIDCGFYDQPHFTRYFKQAMGVTPRQYVKQVCSDQTA